MTYSSRKGVLCVQHGHVRISLPLNYLLSVAPSLEPIDYVMRQRICNVLHVPGPCMYQDANSSRKQLEQQMRIMKSVFAEHLP